MYIEVKEKDGKWIRTNRPLLFNYIFIHASENDIYREMRNGLHMLSFLPRVRDGKNDHYPYISDKDMENLKWVARSYSFEVPIYYPEPKQVIKGDKVRIIDGK